MPFDHAAEAARVIRNMDRYGHLVTHVALPRALNRTRDRVATTGKREVSTRMGLVQAAVTRRLRVKLATRGDLDVSLTFVGSPINLINFKGTKQPKRGRGVRSAAYGALREYPGTFIARMPNGVLLVMKRTSKRRKPIHKVYGPGIARTAASAPVRAALNATARERIGIEFKNALRSVQPHL